MDIVTLLLFILFCTGITNLMVNSTILDIPRDFVIATAYDYNKSLGEMIETLLNCMMCSGFWIGMIFSLFFPINFIVAGATISLTSHFYGLLIGGIEDLSVLTESLTVEAEEE